MPLQNFAARGTHLYLNVCVNPLPARKFFSLWFLSNFVQMCPRAFQETCPWPFFQFLLWRGNIWKNCLVDTSTRGGYAEQYVVHCIHTVYISIQYGTTINTAPTLTFVYTAHCVVLCALWTLRCACAHWAMLSSLCFLLSTLRYVLKVLFSALFVLCAL